jgi:hypothetical protein
VSPALSALTWASGEVRIVDHHNCPAANWFGSALVVALKH